MFVCFSVRAQDDILRFTRKLTSVSLTTRTASPLAKRSAHCLLYFSTNVLCNFFKDHVPRGEERASVPFSECKSTHFCNNGQMFAQKSSGKFVDKLPLSILMCAVRQRVSDVNYFRIVSSYGAAQRAVRNANMGNMRERAKRFGREFRVLC